MVGAGVLGLACAAVLARRGAQVEVIEDRPGTPNASAVAAGMIAPALEAALEGGDPSRADLYRDAAARWPQFAEKFGIRHWCDGTDWRGPSEALAQRLVQLEFDFEERPGGLFLPGESRVAPGQALDSLAPALRRLELTAVGVERTGGRPILQSDGDGGGMAYDAVVLAQGWRAAGFAGLESMLEAITPVKGQLAVLDGPGLVERTVRAEGVYLVPAKAGVIVGASMEPGVSDTGIDEVVIAGLRTSAASLVPGLAGVQTKVVRAGVRGSTPDGLPMAGGTPMEGVFAALAPRRNGWLLAPLVAEVVAAAIAQEPPPPFAEALRPDRFGRAG